MKLNHNVFTPDEFVNIANTEAGRNLLIERITGIVLARDGKQVTLYTADTALRTGEKRLERYPLQEGEHAVDAFARDDQVMLLAGTPGIQANPGRSAVVDGLTAMFVREKKATLVCGKPSAVGYYLWPHHEVTPVDLGALGFIEVAYLSRPRGFVACTGQDNRLYFLSFDDAKIGKTTKEYWKESNAIGDDLTAITAIPARITDAKTVMIQAKTAAGKSAAVLLNLAAIDRGSAATVIADHNVGRILFRGFTNRDTAVVEISQDTVGFEAGTHLVQRNKLETIFGEAGRVLAQPQL